MNPAIDARLAERLREVASLEVDSPVSDRVIAGTLTGAEKSRILNICADTLEEYILAATPLAGGTGCE